MESPIIADSTEKVPRPAVPPKIDFSGGWGYPLGEKTRPESKEIHMLGSIGPTELILILLIVIIIFGARKLPDLGRSIGEGIKNFKKSINTKDEHDGPKPPEAPKG